MTIMGTRNPYTYPQPHCEQFASTCGGGTWSYQPPQSSQVSTIAVLDQVRPPMEFTMEATHEGPEPSLLRAWSDCLPSGITQLTCGSWSLAMSVSTWV